MFNKIKEWFNRPVSPKGKRYWFKIHYKCYEQIVSVWAKNREDAVREAKLVYYACCIAPNLIITRENKE